MTVSSGFFNSHNHDRLYDALQISSIFDGVILDGVYESIGDAFMVSAYGEANDTILVGTGRAWFNHTWTLNDTQFSITLSPPNALLSRIDTVVIDVNLEDNVRANSIKVIEGSYAEEPTSPKLINEELHKQYPIADIKMSSGESGVISQANITYRVGTSDCPLVTGPLTALNLDNYLKQWTAEFEEWFAGIQDILDEHVAQDLQNQIDELRNKQGVNEDGEIGDYVIPFTKEVMQAIVDGGEKIHAQSISIPKFTSDTATFPTGTARSVIPYNQGFILPNGSVCSCAFSTNEKGVGVPNPHAVFGVSITTPEGVTNTTYKERDYRIFNTNAENKHYFGANPIMTNLEADTYPVTFNLSIPYIAYDNDFMESYARNVGSGLFYATITITADNIVTISDQIVSKKYTNDSSIFTNETVCQMPAVLPDETLIYLNLSGESTGQTYYCCCAHKLDPNGVCSSSNFVKISNIGPTIVEEIEGLYTYGFYRGDDEKAVFRYIYNTSVPNLDDGRFSYMQNHSFTVDPEKLSISGSDTLVSIPANKFFTGVGSVSKLDNGNIVKYTYNKSETPITSTEGAFNPIILYDTSASSPVTSASIFADYEIGATTIAVLVNSGSNSRAVFVGKNNIGAYASKFSTTIANASSMATNKVIRNPHRVKTIGNTKYWLFDSATTYTNFTSFSGNSIGTGNIRGETSLVYLKVWYDSED